MPVNQSFVGREYPPTEPYQVSREKIREFAEAIKDDTPAYLSVDAARALGHRDIVAPPTFPIVLTLTAAHQLLFDPEAGIDYGRVVHGEQRFVHERPVYAGDVLQVVVHVDEIRVAAGNDLITTRAEARTPEGELVVTAFSTTVVRGPER
jgi:acyl dehydratase